MRTESLAPGGLARFWSFCCPVLRRFGQTPSDLARAALRATDFMDFVSKNKHFSQKNTFFHRKLLFFKNKCVPNALRIWKQIKTMLFSEKKGWENIILLRYKHHQNSAWKHLFFQITEASQIASRSGPEAIWLASVKRKNTCFQPKFALFFQITEASHIASRSATQTSSMIWKKKVVPNWISCLFWTACGNARFKYFDKIVCKFNKISFYRFLSKQ